MNKYNMFLTFFILSIAALIFFLVVYLQAIFTFAIHADEFPDHNTLHFFSTVFSPAVIISGFVLAFSSLIYRVLGIVYVARNKTVADGEKAFWIIGFVIMGFITGIVFLVMAKGKKFVE